MSFLCEGLCGRTIINDVKGRLTLETLIKGSKIVLQPFTGVYDVDLWVFPDPGALLISLVVHDCGAEDNDVLKDSTIRPLQEVEDIHCFSTASLTTNDGRVWIAREHCVCGVPSVTATGTTSRVLRQIDHLRC